MAPATLLRSIGTAGLLLIACGPALAQPLYRAMLETPPPPQAIVRDTRWSCAAGDCTAPRLATSPDAVMCAAIARKLGRVASFAAGDRVFAADELEKCNSAAK